MFQNEAFVLLLSYSVLVLLASLAGGLVPLGLRLSHQRMELALSTVAGFMLGVAFLHLLPHALQNAGRGSDAWVPAWVLGGLFTTFLAGRFLSTHRHESEAAAAPAPWLGAFAGFGLHTLVGGVALAASARADAGAALLPGFAMFIVILLHKPLDAMAIATLVRAAGGPARRLHLVNLAFASLTGVGALLFVVLGDALSGQAGSAALLAPALAFSAGTFICIALNDLLPELRFHSHDRWALTGALLGGLLLAALLAAVEVAGHDDRDHRHAALSHRPL